MIEKNVEDARNKCFPRSIRDQVRAADRRLRPSEEIMRIDPYGISFRDCATCYTTARENAKVCTAETLMEDFLSGGNSSVHQSAFFLMNVGTSRSSVRLGFD